MKSVELFDGSGDLSGDGREVLFNGIDFCCGGLLCAC